MKSGADGLHPEVLPEPQIAALQVLAGPVDERAFHLAGGTALALQLGHRRSVDFDWFRQQEIPDPLSLGRELHSRCAGFEVRSSAPGTLHASVAGVRTSFFHYAYPLLRPVLRWEKVGIDLAAPEDIAAMKLVAVVQRAAKKDFFDLAALLEQRLELGTMLELYRERYSVKDVAHVLAALTWFEDAERDPEPIAGSRTSWQDVKARLRTSVKAFLG